MLTEHAKLRLEERTSLSHEEFLCLVSRKRYTKVGFERNSSREHHLFFSSPDDGFRLFVMDAAAGVIVTVLCCEYWLNLVQKGNYQTVGFLAKSDFVDVLRMESPDHRALTYPPLFKKRFFKIWDYAVDADGARRTKTLGTFRIADWVRQSKACCLEQIAGVLEKKPFSDRFV